MTTTERSAFQVLPAPEPGWTWAFHVTERRLVPRILREGLKPRLGKRSRVARETQPRIYLLPDWTSLEDGMTNWLADEFVTRTSILAVEVPVQDLQQDEVRWEATVLSPIPPTRIRLVIEDTDEAQAA